VAYGATSTLILAAASDSAATSSGYRLEDFSRADDGGDGHRRGADRGIADIAGGRGHRVSYDDDLVIHQSAACSDI
jgi:hypothetical protein